MIKDLNKRHGYKHSMEYLKNNKYSSYAVYLILKIIDYANVIKLVNTWQYNFKYDLPGEKARLNVVDDELYKYHNSELKFRCIGEKYCIREYKIFENTEIAKKIIRNTSQKINNLYNDTQRENKKFVLIIHPSPKYFYPEKTNVNYSDLNDQMISQLNKQIKVINLTNDLRELDAKDSKINLFYEYDGHYTIEGYKIVSNIILKKLNQILN